MLSSSPLRWDARILLGCADAGWWWSWLWLVSVESSAGAGGWRLVSPHSVQTPQLKWVTAGQDAVPLAPQWDQFAAQHH